MSLILAIEPNKTQAHQLNALVRQHLKAELVTAPTAAAALAALGDRIPDVVLTPALFGLRDEAALTDRLRQLGTDGSHVQTLAIPILASGPSRGPNNSLLGRKKDNKADANVGCDPAIFAEQIKVYLQRASVERRAQASEAAARAMATARPAATADESAGDELSAFMVGADELDVDSLELQSIEPPVATAPEPAQTQDTLKAAPAASSSDESHGRWNSSPSATSTTEEESGLVTPPPAGPPLWRAPDSTEGVPGNGGDAKAASTSKASAESARPAPRPRRTPPQPDEWTYFDPSQSAFKALIRRLDEIAGSAA
jgi:CheY-like chemotaxis protein